MTTTPQTIPSSTPLCEYCDWRGAAPQIDRQQGILRGVKILGLRSQNGRVYLPEALAAAVGLYEGAKVNVNHPKGHPRAPRDYQERIGSLHDVAVRLGDGLYGDLHFNPRHALAEQLLWDAANAPQNVGFSHNVEARTARRDQQTVVEAITRVVSVDLVADPATTAGLFEAAAAATDVTVDDAPSSMTDALSTLTCEQLRVARPDLVEALLLETRATWQQLNNENTTLREQVEQLRREANAAASRPVSRAPKNVAPQAVALDTLAFVRAVRG